MTSKKQRSQDEKKPAPATDDSERRQQPPPNGGNRASPRPDRPAVPEDPLDESSWESFPASDPPAH